MKYSKELAISTIERFALSPNTESVWKSRGKIPKKYFSDNFENRVQAPEKTIQLIRDRLNTNWINYTAFQVEKQSIYDVRDQDYNPSITWCKLVQDDFNAIKKLVRKFTNNSNEKNLLLIKSEKRIKWSTFFGDQKKIIDRIRKRDVNDSELTELKKAAKLRLLEL